MVFGEVLAKYYSKHTSGIVIDNLKEQIEETYDQIPVIKDRIEILQNLEVTKELQENITDKLGKGIGGYVNKQETLENQWKLYNYLTYYISHIVHQRMRASYQMKVSRLFQL